MNFCTSILNEFVYSRANRPEKKSTCQNRKVNKETQMSRALNCKQLHKCPEGMRLRRSSWCPAPSAGERQLPMHGSSMTSISKSFERSISKLDTRRRHASATQFYIIQIRQKSANHTKCLPSSAVRHRAATLLSRSRSRSSKKPPCRMRANS